MRIGIGDVLPHSLPQEWFDEIVEMCFRAAAFPGNYQQPGSLIDAYVKAVKERDIMIAEVGAWSNPFPPDKACYEKTLRYVKNIAGEWL